ncbi:hypothetical protein CDAR_546041 [Caerostris darwini]|uniref:Uncharacterized protein n=1 Tax=Caerostris darwini TaxID=1538125 RepID=A0AAV4X7A3_9ARAC|nr:hypothetical protein CDAR_546041 [Caerostris darwini]
METRTNSFNPCYTSADCFIIRGSSWALQIETRVTMPTREMATRQTHLTLVAPLQILHRERFPLGASNEGSGNYADTGCLETQFVLIFDQPGLLLILSLFMEGVALPNYAVIWGVILALNKEK